WNRRGHLSPARGSLQLHPGSPGRVGPPPAGAGSDLGAPGTTPPAAARDPDGRDALRRTGGPGHRYAGRPRVGRNRDQPHPQGGESVSSTKYIFVTGGVVSSLGKGIAAASL